MGVTGAGDEGEEAEAGEAGLYGIGFYYNGLRLVFAAYALFLFIRVLGPASKALSAAQQTGPYQDDATVIVLAILAIAVFLALFLGLFFATFLFISVHNVDLVFSSTVETSDPSFIVRGGHEASRTVPVEPELFFPPEFAWLFYLLPPALLLLAGFAEFEAQRDIVSAVVTVVVGYGLMALLTIGPVAWVFNAYIAEFVANLASSPLTEATLEIQLRDAVRAHLMVGLVYPLVFGGLGAVAAQFLEE